MISPLLLCGQTNDPNVVFYSKGKMYVKHKTDGTWAENSSTALYIDGSAKFGTGAAVVQRGRTDITGDFINAKDPNATAAQETGLTTLFTRGASASDPIYSTGVVAFVGDKEIQYIKSDRADWKDQKAINYINFPTILVNKTIPSSPYDGRKEGYVALDTTAAIVVDTLWAPSKNRFSVLAGYNTRSGQERELFSGFMLLKNTKNVASNGNQIPATNLATYAQVNLDMYKYDGATDDGAFAANHTAAPATAGKTLRNAAGYNHLTGFAPPFEQLGADYMFYHHLTVPTGAGYGDAQADPHFAMQNGNGYFISMDVSSYLHNHIDTRWAGAAIISGSGSISHTNRARGGYVFNRRLLVDEDMGSTANDGNSKGFSRFSYDPADVQGGDFKTAIKLMDKEKFVTGDVQIKLKKGFNFLGNPYMTPISLNPILGLSFTNYAGTTSTQVAGGSTNAGFVPDRRFIDIINKDGIGVNISSFTVDKDIALRSAYWVMNSSTVFYNNTDNIYAYTTTYDYISRDGATLAANVRAGVSGNPVVTDAVNYLISPMQLFCIQASQEDVTLTLKETLRTFGGQTRFLKSAAADDLYSDFFVVESTGSVDQLSDRTAVIFRERAQMDSRDPYDAMKFMFSDTEVARSSKLKSAESTTLTEPMHSVVYTKSQDGKRMLGNAVLPKTKELALYVTPPHAQQNMTLKFYGLENLESVPGVWLIDRYQDNKTMQVTPDFEYQYVGGPSDSSEDNRFILRFWDGNDDILNEEKPITCYYNTSVLYISGLNEGDINSSVQIYDLQGRLLANTKVDNAPSMEYVKPLSLGTYIVKIAGKRNFTSKFVNLQN